MKTILAAAFVAVIALEAGAADGAGHYFANLKLVDQNGKTVDLYDDLMKGKVVVINSFFASCSGACPVMAGAFKKIEGIDDPRLSLISITVDPANDTPAKLKEYAARMKAGGEWRFLTGSPAQVNAVLTKLGLSVEAREAHANIFLVGNLETGLWKKVFGLAKTEDVVAAVRSVVEDKAPKVPTP